VATEHDGLTAAAVAAVDIDAEALAAFASALHKRARQASAAAGYGEVAFLAVDAGEGRLFVAGRSEMAIVVLTDGQAAAGPVRLAIRRSLDAIV
jgi:predicted regulator of Ras-like GTPase activity (Roadblock/LC7/MglB family)